MRLLAIDIGSSGVKCAVMEGGTVVGAVARGSFRTCYDGPRVEADAVEILDAVSTAIAALGESARRVDVIIPTTMAPSWLATDRRGKPLTKVVTHQDRRAVEQAKAIERRVGAKRHLRLAGNRPFPGGISSTTWRWHVEHHRPVMKRAALVGHVSTALLFELTGARVTDPSNASFMGVYRTTTLGGWSDELLGAIDLDRALLPEVLEADRVAGRVTPAGATRFGVREGTPVLAGLMDGSCPMLLAGARAGQLVNVAGSTDVLALCVERPVPSPDRLTRALGVGRRWLSVRTTAAAGSAIDWARRVFFSELSDDDFYALVGEISKSERSDARRRSATTPRFDTTLAGDRMSLEPLTGKLDGLTLSTDRRDILSALLDDLARRSATHLRLLSDTGTRVRSDVLLTGGTGAVADVLHRDWPKRFTFRHEDDATLRGLWKLVG